MTILTVTFFINPNAIEMVGEIEKFKEDMDEINILNFLRDQIYNKLKTPNNVYKLYNFRKHPFWILDELYGFFHLELEILDTHTYCQNPNIFIDLSKGVLTYKGVVLTTLNIVDYFTGYGYGFTSNRKTNYSKLSATNPFRTFKRLKFLSLRPHVLRHIRTQANDKDLKTYKHVLRDARGLF